MCVVAVIERERQNPDGPVMGLILHVTAIRRVIIKVSALKTSCGSMQKMRRWRRQKAQAGILSLARGTAEADVRRPPQ